MIFQGNLRLEIFDGDREIGAVNFHHSTEGETNVTIEADLRPACDGTNSNISTFRLYERFIQNSSSFSLEQRLYKDIFYFYAPSYHRCYQTKGDRGLLMEEKVSVSNEKYMYNVMFSDGKNVKNLYSSLENSRKNTKFQLGVMTKQWDYNHKTVVLQNDDRVNLEMKGRANESEDYSMIISYNNNLIFDGWFYLTPTIRNYARNKIPFWVDKYLAKIDKTNNELSKILTKYV